MANILSNLFGPVAPGLSPTINPISMLGAGMYSGNPAAALAQMGQMQQAGQQLAFNQQMQQQKMAMLQAEAKREAEERAGQQRAAMALVNPTFGMLGPNVLEEQRQALETIAQDSPETLMAMYASGAGPFAMPTGPEPPKLSDISGQRKEFAKQSQTWQTTRDAFERIEASEATGPGDISLLTGYMKMLDPGSTVREGEFATAANAGGVSNQIRGLYNSVVRGEKLTPELRAQFKNQAAKFLESQRDRQLVREEAYTGMATRAGLLPADVVPDYLGKYRDEIPSFSAPTPEPEVGSPLTGLPPGTITPTQQEAILRNLPSRFR